MSDDSCRAQDRSRSGPTFAAGRAHSCADEPSGTTSTPCLIASAPGNEGQLGGVFAVGGEGCELLDPVRTTGMTVSPDGTRLARLTWADGRSDLAELLVSDRSGLLNYRRLDDVGEPHSLLWVGDELHVVSTASNSVVVVDESGRTKRTWHATGAVSRGDRWHLNSLAHVDRRILVTAFGTFGEIRAWARPGALSGAGVVLDLATREVVLSGFAAPHDPTWLGDGWVICNSFTGEVLRLDPHGRQIASAQLGGWTRGVLVDDGLVYVGVSAPRLANPATRARIAVLDRATLREIGRLAMPTRDVFALCPYDEQLANGLRVGTRLGAASGLGSSVVVMDHPLAEADSIARLELVEATPSGASVRVTNLSAAIMSSIGRHPVRVGARRWDPVTQGWLDVARADLPAPLYPHRHVTLDIDMGSAGPDGGPIRLGIVQEAVRWFDELDDSSAEVHLLA